VNPETLRQWRTEVKGWTVVSAAKWWGCNVRTWRRYESGERKVPLPLAKRVRAQLNFNAE